MQYVYVFRTGIWIGLKKVSVIIIIICLTRNALNIFSYKTRYYYGWPKIRFPE